MLRVTQDVVEIRRWAEAREVRPCRDTRTGRLTLASPGEPCTEPVGWEEFEPAFMHSHATCCYDDAPGARRSFVGAEHEVHAFLSRALGLGDAAARP
jgi:hypothetical protein